MKLYIRSNYSSRKQKPEMVINIYIHMSIYREVSASVVINPEEDNLFDAAKNLIKSNYESLISSIKLTAMQYELEYIGGGDSTVVRESGDVSISKYLDFASKENTESGTVRCILSLRVSDHGGDVRDQEEYIMKRISDYIDKGYSKNNGIGGIITPKYEKMIVNSQNYNTITSVLEAVQSYFYSFKESSSIPYSERDISKLLGSIQQKIPRIVLSSTKIEWYATRKNISGLDRRSFYIIIGTFGFS